MQDTALYVVATPIGNLQDMTPRAVDVLNQVAVIAAEDTRHSARLMAHFNIKTPLISVHEHNERQRVERILQYLSQGESVALISDAGTPVISDPGFVLVRAVREAGFRVVPVPGCVAFVTALCASGLPSDRFSFEGFPPAKSQARQQFYRERETLPHTLVFYESPHRILASLTDMAEVFGPQRRAAVARELTKTFETIHCAPLAELLDWMAADSNQQRGEFVLMVEGAVPKPADQLDDEALRVLDILLAELSVKQSSALAAQITGIKKKLLYQAALERS
ncbi:16S rRNA (cytidine(1402)-2'-O)-methyltransferase [Marinobacterium arenosum]|uniref:16S rRNA (cytidine(1402)-2'-O)-methyltransferase n=1 Tax=Marinobacterium arenosum TaxID=2862496 RepID=UPI001C959632|nr:16S rRNA (cytidine(1402)-2'-O)-methyltransferase [Marinobacterium arenosum]MBY4676608.1 16S rRNA (cytidine(1402)-2'-O)-methyltransferase [Marinobacterium arenosum]